MPLTPLQAKHQTPNPIPKPPNGVVLLADGVFGSRVSMGSEHTGSAEGYNPEVLKSQLDIHMHSFPTEAGL